MGLEHGLEGICHGFMGLYLGLMDLLHGLVGLYLGLMDIWHGRVGLYLGLWTYSMSLGRMVQKHDRMDYIMPMGVWAYMMYGPAYTAPC